MKSSLVRIVFLLVVTLIGLTTPQAAPPAAEKIDPAAIASPTKPLPAWLKGDGKFIDQEANDKRLKGYITPEGIKVEIVADCPTVINPVGMTFSTDGTPYVLEWRPSPGDEWRETAETITYKDGSQRKIATMKKRVKDDVKTLASTKNDGIYDKDHLILRRRAAVEHFAARRLAVPVGPRQRQAATSRASRAATTTSRRSSPRVSAASIIIRCRA